MKKFTVKCSAHLKKTKPGNYWKLTAQSHYKLTPSIT